MPHPRVNSDPSIRPENLYSDQRVSGHESQPIGRYSNRTVKEADQKEPLIKIWVKDRAIEFNETSIDDRKIKEIREGIEKKIGLTPRNVAKRLAAATREGVYVGGAYAGVAGFAIGGPPGAIAVGVVGTIVGAIFGLGGQAVRELTGSMQLSMPHKKKWLNKLIGPTAVDILVKKKPTPEEIEVVEIALDRAEKRMTEILNNPKVLKDPKKTDKYVEQFKTFRSVVDVYLEEAKHRMSPEGKLVVDNFRSSADPKAAREQLMRDVNYLIEVAKEAPPTKAMKSEAMKSEAMKSEAMTSLDYLVRALPRTSRYDKEIKTLIQKITSFRKDWVGKA